MKKIIIGIIVIVFLVIIGILINGIINNQKKMNELKSNIIETQKEISITQQNTLCVSRCGEIMVNNPNVISESNYSYDNQTDTGMCFCVIRVV